MEAVHELRREEAYALPPIDHTKKIVVWILWGGRDERYEKIGMREKRRREG